MALAARVGRVAAEFDAGHDRDATFVTEAYDEMHACGYLRLPVPAELGGLGATMRQVVLAEEELGSHSGAAALSAAMHLYLTLVQRWRRRRGAPDAEGVLRRVADDGLVLATSGGSDWVCPTTTAVEVPRRVPARRAQAVLQPGAGRRGDLDVRDARRARPGRGRAARRRAAVRARGLDRRDLGHAGHARHREPRRGVRRGFLPAEKVIGQRPYGVLAGPLLAAAIHFAPVAGAAYLGVARGACDEAVRLVGARR